jgi:hypothetical protein
VTETTPLQTPEASPYTDADFRAAMLRAVRLVVILGALGAAVAWWKLGWQSAVLLLVGAAISASGLWEWLRLMTAVMARMDSAEAAGRDAGLAARPLAGVLATFFLRLGGIVVVLYVSLKYLQGSAWTLAIGLILGVFALTFEGLKLVRAWTS